MTTQPGGRGDAASARARGAGPRLGALRGAILAAGLLVYANALGGPFLLDDFASIVHNPHVRTLDPLWSAMWAEHENPLRGRPLPALSMALNFAAGGLDPAGYKAVNLALHLACALALFGLVRRTLRSRTDAWLEAAATTRGSADRVAFAVALLWCVHPLAGECVNYVTQRTESLMALFLLVTLWAIARSHDAKPSLRGRWRSLALAACLGGMVSKEVMIVAPLLVALYERSYSGESWSQLARTRRPLAFGLLLCMAAHAALIAATFRTHTVGTDSDTTSLDYLWNQGWVIARYLRLVVVPYPLSAEWGVPRDLQLVDVWPEVALVGVLAVGSLALWLRRPALGFPLVAVFVVLAPTSSFVPILTEVAAERRMYVPSMALIAFAVTAAVGGLRKTVARRWLEGWSGLALLVVAALTLGLLTARRNLDYRSEKAILASAVAAFPDNPRAIVRLGANHYVAGESELAIDLYREALALDEGYGEGHNELGIALVQRGQVDEGLAHFDRAIELLPKGANAQYNRGLALLRRRQRGAAIASFERAVRLDRGYAKALVQLAWMRATDPDPALREPKQAERLALRALALEGAANALTLDVLGAALAAQGNFARAAEVAARAKSVALATGEVGRVDAIAARLASYRRGEAFVATAAED